MTNRLDRYDDKALTLDELEAFKTFWVRCIDSEGAPPPLRSGHRYLVIGEETTYIDGRPLNKIDERWILSVGEAAPQEFFKSRFIPETEFLEWRLTSIRARLDSLMAELEAMESQMAGSKVAWAIGQIKVLDQALKFSQDIERQLRERIDALETKLKFNSANYSEGGSGDFINNDRYEEKP